jgi:heat shock protein HslJ
MARRLRSIACVLAALFVASVAGGCTPTDEDSRSATQGLPDTLQRLVAHEWTLDHQASTTPPVAARVTLSFNNRHTLVGQGPCNTYSGVLVISGRTIRITHLFSSDAMCDPATMQAEREYFNALARIDRADTTDRDRLVLKGSRSTELVYEAQGPRAELIGSWRIRRLDRNGRLSLVLDTTQLIVTFRTGGQLSVSGSCNPIASSWTLDAPSISIEPVRSGRKACDEPPGVMAQEADLAVALESAAVVSLSTTQLSLYDSDGEQVLLASRQVGGS